MDRIYNTYLHILQNNPEKINITVSSGDVPFLSTLVQKHFTAPFLLPYIKQYPDTYMSFKKQTKQMMFHYYQVEHFTNLIVSLLNKEQIPYYLLKGISLAAYYPMPEYRKLGDVDLYIPDPDALKRAKKILESSGFTLDPELSDHHITYLYTFPKTGRTYILELHFRIVGLYQYDRANQIIDQVFSGKTLTPVFQTIGDSTYQVLPPTEYTFYMIHHMLKHYLYSGFGIRLLCDFTLYLTAQKDEIDFSKLHIWCKESKILHFYEIIITTLHLYLGLAETIEPDIHYSKDACETFILRILEERDMGSSNSTALVGSGSYAKINLWTYIREGHLQMKVRFPRLQKCIILWPVLWIITLICFLYNTHHHRHTTLRATLTDFKKSNADSQLIQIFENED